MFRLLKEKEKLVAGETPFKSAILWLRFNYKHNKNKCTWLITLFPVSRIKLISI